MRFNLQWIFQKVEKVFFKILVINFSYTSVNIGPVILYGALF